jgi:hypothetical protein
MPPHGKCVLGWNGQNGCFVCFVSEHEVTDDGGPIWEASNVHTGVGNPEPYTLEYEDEWPTHWMALPKAPT